MAEGPSRPGLASIIVRLITANLIPPRLYGGVIFVYTDIRRRDQRADRVIGYTIIP